MSSSELARKLAQPFEPTEVEWKPQSTSGERALAIAYVDARCVMDRLDEVFGVDGWQDDYQLLPDGSAVCRLSVLCDGAWITRTDVGGESDQKDEGDRRKASFSDALKRAAVKFGVGRYLYRLPPQWVDWDAQKRTFKTPPQLPVSALPDYAGDLARATDKAALAEIGRRIAAAHLPEKVRTALTAAYKVALARIKMPPAGSGDAAEPEKQPEPEAAGAPG